MNDPPIRILLVEDDPGDARLLHEMLADVGTIRSELVWSTQLGEALQRLSAESFDVILLDLSLADSQGWGTFDKMHGHTTHVPIVVLTGLDDEAVAVRAMGEGAQDFLVKGHVDGQLLARAICYAIERQQLATALIQTRQQQLEMKDQLLSHVSHEFRTSLMAILWYARNLLDGREGVTPEQRNALGVILRNAQQLGTMIGDLLESTQAQTGKLTIEPQCLSLVEVIPETLRTPEASAAAKQIRLSADVRGFLPPVYADADRVPQILINIIETPANLPRNMVRFRSRLRCTGRFQPLCVWRCAILAVASAPRARTKFSSVCTRRPTPVMRAVKGSGSASISVMNWWRRIEGTSGSKASSARAVRSSLRYRCFPWSGSCRRSSKHITGR
jgi:DNA-binding response OmpR family regulator